MDNPRPLVSTPSRTPSRTPTRGGKGLARTGPAREPLPAGTLLKDGAFRIVQVIGEGGFSITYLGEEGQRRLRVAIKELFPLGCVRHGLRVLPANHWDAKMFQASLDDFDREGLLLKSFNHPSIVRSYSPFLENGTGYLAMELIEGESLLLGLQRRGQMNETQAYEVAQQIGGALRLMHDNCLIHSDVKPENIIHTLDHRFVLLDFGISRRSMPGRASKAAVLAVSPGFSPPEQYQASKQLSPATDVYALAATLYTMLASALPPEATARVRGAVLPRLSDLNASVTPAFQNALEGALALSPEQRPQSITDFLDRLDTPGARNAPSPESGRVSGAARVESLAEIEAHRGAVNSLAIHPHQPLLLSGAKSGSIGVWSWPQGAPAGQLKAHDCALTSFALSPDGSLLATAGEPGEVKLWNADNGQMLRVMRNGPPAVHHLAFSRDSQAVATAMADGTVHIFLPQRADPVVLPGHLGPVNSVAFAPDGTMMATGGQDCAINIWDLQTTSLVGHLKGHTKPVLFVEFSHDSALLLSGSSDLSARSWEIRSGLEMRRYSEHRGLVWSGAFTCDPDVVVTACADKKLRFFRLSTGREACSVDADKHNLRSVVCDPNYPVVATSGGDGHIRIWRFQS